jgi:hypothetical protein
MYGSGATGTQSEAVGDMDWVEEKEAAFHKRLLAPLLFFHITGAIFSP